MDAKSADGSMQLVEHSPNAGAVYRDLRLSWRKGGTLPSDVPCAGVDHIVGCLPDLVYTAFDGDHFALTSAMKRYVIGRGLVPASPESIIGYRDAVIAHGSKLGVLMDDLAIAGRCDRIWVFTDVEPTPTAVATGLAEGALFELLWFLRVKGAHSDKLVEFVPVDALFNLNARRCPYLYSYADTAGALAGDQHRLVQLIDSLFALKEPFRPVVAIMHDPLDTKYVHWLRAGAHTLRGQVPLVLQLAVEIGDAPNLALLYEPDGRLSANSPSVLACWIALLRLADSYLDLPSIEEGRSQSEVALIMSHAWSKVGNGRSIEVGEWIAFETPKSTPKAKLTWALTDRERLNCG